MCVFNSRQIGNTLLKKWSECCNDLFLILFLFLHYLVPQLSHFFLFLLFFPPYYFSNLGKAINTILLFLS